MLVGKWNYEKDDYDPYVIPGEWHTPLYTDNMDEIVNCVQCGKELTFGGCYTSKEIHSNIGIGYGVCPDCYEKEWDRYVRSKQCSSV